MRDILVIRFGALGDLCVLGWALARLADEQSASGRRVTLVTKAAFVPLLAEFRGIDQVTGLADTSLAGVNQLATRLRRQPWAEVLDAHNTLRSRLLLGLMARRPRATLGKDTVARLQFMWRSRHDASLDQRMLDRFHSLTETLTGPGQPPAVTPPLLHLRQSVRSATRRESPIIGLAPGAQWDTKRWPAAHFAELLHLLQAQYHGKVRIYLGPREASWYRDSPLAAAVAQVTGAEVVQLPGLPDVARSLAELQVLVTNDSGLLHLAEAVGTPVLAFFGPTVREFGYFPLLPESRVLERAETCRPCSRNGKRPCHRRDLACLNLITPPEAMAALGQMLVEGAP